MNKQKTTLRRRFPALTSQRGMSLVELMVAMTIGIFLIGAVGVIYVNTSTTSRSSTLESQMNEDASLALELLQQQLRLAGFSTSDAAGVRQFSGIAVKGCDGGFSVSGTDDDNEGTTKFSALKCKTAGSDPDAISVRYEATALNSQTVSTGEPGNCNHEAIAAWDAATAGEGGTASVALADNRYFIANDDTNGDDIPSLYCKGRTGGGFGNANALIPNIEDMQISYGVTTLPVDNEAFPNQVTAYVDASNEVLGSTDEKNWSRVVAIRICLIARSANPVPAGDNSLAQLGWYRDCSGEEVTDKTDRYLRRAYVTTIQLRNTRPALPAAYALDAGTAKDPWRDVSKDEE